MSIRLGEIFMRLLGWCPGPEAAAEFNQRKGTEKLAGLLTLLGIWLIGYWWFTETAIGLYGMEKMLYINRTNLMLLLGGIVLVGYTWKQFKPSDWELPEFSYRPISIDELPDIPVEDSVTWGTGSHYYRPIAVDPQWGREDYKVVGVTETDIDWYRDKIEHNRDLRDERLRREGKPVPKRPSNKTPIIRILVFLFLVAGSMFTYSYMVLHPQQMAVEAYAFDRLSGFELVVVKPYDHDILKTRGSIPLNEFDEFISIARDQGVKTIYYKVEEEPSNYFIFLSSISSEAYRIHLSDISP
jgi:hypothetical protein